MRHRDRVVAPDAFVASSAVLVGDVRVGPAAVIDYGAIRDPAAITLPAM